MVATVVELRSSAMAVTYYERDGYYAKNDPEHRQASFWYGDAAKALGLKAHVRPSRFESVLSGYVPGMELRLGRMREGEHDHRPGWDITLSAPKSVSLEALVMGDRRVIRAHDEAVRATLAFVEAELLQTRGLGPGDATASPGEREWHGGGRVPPSREPRPGPAAAHPLRACQHDAECVRGMAERGADEDPAQ